MTNRIRGWFRVCLCTSLSFSACTFGTPESICSSNAECQDAFGWGRVCSGDGLCEYAVPEPRCDKTIPSDLLINPDLYRDRIVLGATMERVDSVQELKGMELAINQVNDNGGLEGRLFAMIQCDNVEDQNIDARTATEAVGDIGKYLGDRIGAPVIVGAGTSGNTAALYQAIETLGTLIISPSATSPSLTDLDGLSHSDEQPGRLWRTAPPDSIQGTVIALDMIARNIEDVAVIYEQGPYGEGLAEAFAENFAGDGRAYTFYLFDTDSQRDTAMTDVGAGGYQEVFFISSDEGDIPAFLNGAATQSNYTATNIGIFLPDVAYDTGMLEQTRDNASDTLFPRIRGTRSSVPAGIVYDQFVASYAAAYGGELASGYSAHSYDATWLAIYSTSWSLANEGKISSLGMARGLRKVSSGTSVEIRPTSWNTVHATFESGQGIDVVGASGPLNFDPATEETASAIDIWIINESGTGFEIIDTITPP